MNIRFQSFLRAVAAIASGACGAGLAWAQSAPAPASAAAPQIEASSVMRCRTIAEAPARLACYDAIALPGIGSRAGWGAPVPSATTAAAPAAVPSAVAGFGLERLAGSGGPDRLESRLNGRIDGWNAGSRFTLENGQVWQVSDGSSAYYPNLGDQPRVTITRGILGSFFIAIEGVTQQVRVRRIQ